jgi:hypothetical protein
VKYQPPFDPAFAGPVDGIYNDDADAEYVNGNPATGEEGSIPPMESVAHTMKEVVHVIENAGLLPSHEDLEQLRKAIKKMIEDGTESNPTTGGAVEIWEGLSTPDKLHKIRALKAGSNVSIDLVEEPTGSGRYQIVISATATGGGGGDLSVTNVGTGAQVHKETVSDVARLRSIKAVDGLSATQNADDITIGAAGLGQYLPFFPEIETSDNKLTITNSTGQVIVAADQSFIHRGLRRILTSDTLLASRTFATSANKIYHLRWQWTAGTPVYVLKDLADTGYNPGAAAETSAIFDSKYDDMLIARVVTNGSNAPTVTALRNKHDLKQMFAPAAATRSGTPVNGQGANTETFAIADLNWARTPMVLPVWMLQGVGSSGVNTGFSPDDVHDHDEVTIINVNTRYALSIAAARDYQYTLQIRVLITC